MPKRKLNMGGSKDIYEVEDILKSRLDTSGTKIEYLIKWADSEKNGWPPTWEPESNLIGAKEIVERYYLRKIGLNSGCKARVAVEMNKDMKIHVRVTLDEPPNSEVFTTLRRQYGEFVQRINHFYAPQLGKHEVNIDCPVGVLASPPDHFELIADNKFLHSKDGEGRSENAAVGCECVLSTRAGVCQDCTGHGSGGTCSEHPGPSYDKDGRLANCTRGVLLVECNTKCRCNEKCSQRVVQRKELQHPFSISYISGGKGWGLRVGHAIAQGTFVIEYLGEIISDAEADQRCAGYSLNQRTHVFGLRCTDSITHGLSIDSTRYGNLARFINHSCEPNLRMHPVWVDEASSAAPRVAFFASRDIAKGEELTFDYTDPGLLNAPTKPKHKLPPAPRTEKVSGRIKCLCKSKRCRGFIQLPSG